MIFNIITTVTERSKSVGSIGRELSLDPTNMLISKPVISNWRIVSCERNGVLSLRTGHSDVASRRPMKGGSVKGKSTFSKRNEEARPRVPKYSVWYWRYVSANSEKTPAGIGVMSLQVWCREYKSKAGINKAQTPTFM